MVMGEEHIHAMNTTPESYVLQSILPIWGLTISVLMSMRALRIICIVKDCCSREQADLRAENLQPVNQLKR